MTKLFITIILRFLSKSQRSLGWHWFKLLMLEIYSYRSVKTLRGGILREFCLPTFVIVSERIRNTGKQIHSFIKNSCYMHNINILWNSNYISYKRWLSCWDVIHVLEIVTLDISFILCCTFSWCMLSHVEGYHMRSDPLKLNILFRSSEGLLLFTDSNAPLLSTNTNISFPLPSVPHRVQQRSPATLLVCREHHWTV